MDTDLPPMDRKGPKGELPEAHFPDLTFHDDEKLTERAMQAVHKHYELAAEDNDVYEDAVWKVQDWMAKCGKDVAKNVYGSDSASTTTSTTKNGDETEADTGSTMVYSLIRVLATQIASVWFSDDYPFKYTPANSGFHGFDSLDEGGELAAQYNRLARKTMDLDDFKTKGIELLYQLIKYSNVPLHIFWDYEVHTRRQRVPIREVIDGKLMTKGFEFVEGEYVTKNHPSLRIIPPENFYANRMIPNIEDQECVIVKSLVSYAQLWGGQRAGNYYDIEEVGVQHLYSGNDRSNMTNERSINIGLTGLDDSESGQYLLHDVWVRLPIDDDGKWDGKKNEWRWFWMTIVGEISNGKCIRFQRNPDPDDEPPFLMLHAQPDDGDELYHFGPTQALESNYREETTAKNQMIDSKTLQLRRPLVGVRGEVYSDDLTYEQNKVIWVENKDSLTTMPVPSVVFDCKTVLDALMDDSKRTVGALDSVMGEAMGARTSATEADNAFNQALQPSMVGIRYIAHQFFPWYARKIYRNWQLYSLPDQVFELTHEDQKYEVKPADMWGEFDVNVTVVDEYVATQEAKRNIAYVMELAAANPKIAETIDLEKMIMEILRVYKITKNPAEFIKRTQNLEAMALAKSENDLMQELMPVEVDPGHNHEVHLSEHKMFRERIRGLEDVPEFVGVAQLLDLHIKQHEMLMQQAQQAMAQQQQGPAPAPAGGQNLGAGLPGAFNQAAFGAEQ